MADPVNNPPHYQGAGGLEVIDVVEGFELGFRLGNTVKYILRAGKKGAALEDLKKARWYLDREIAKREQPTPRLICLACGMTPESGTVGMRCWMCPDGVIGELITP